MKLHTIFLLVIWQTSREKYRPNEAGNFFCALCMSVNLAVNLLPIDSLTDQKFPVRVFFFFLMNWFYSRACK
jgi:hypothetical protein